MENICRYYLAVNEKRSNAQTSYGSFAFLAFLVQQRQIMLTAPYADIKGPKSACKTKHDEGERLPCPQIKSVDTLGCLNREQKSGWYSVHAQDDLNLRFKHLCLKRKFRSSCACKKKSKTLFRLAGAYEALLANLPFLLFAFLSWQHIFSSRAQLFNANDVVS